MRESPPSAEKIVAQVEEFARELRAGLSGALPTVPAPTPPVDKPVRRHRLPDVKAAVLHLLDAAPTGLAFGEIRSHESLNRVSDVTVRQALTDLRQADQITMTGARRTALYWRNRPPAT